MHGHGKCGWFLDSSLSPPHNGLAFLCLNVPFVGHGMATFEEIKAIIMAFCPDGFALERLRPWRGSVMAFPWTEPSFLDHKDTPTFLSSLPSSASSRSKLFLVSYQGTHFTHTFQNPKPTTIFYIAM